VAVSVKFCGLTRVEDARDAIALGAAYIGAIFAEGPRLMTPEGARHLFSAAGNGAQRVGVFGADAIEQAADTAERVGLDVIQLHGDPRAADVRAVRARFGGFVWAAARAEGSLLPEWSEELFREADAVLVDTHVAGRLGGTGVALPWDRLARSLDALRGSTPLVLAGGLTPENVAQAVQLLSPDVVDVSSGVERSPGIKDPDRMRAFIKAARGTAP
jgi:phosphoribosylanthranilate isomerase